MVPNRNGTQHSTAQHNTTQQSPAQHNTTQFNAAHPNTPTPAPPNKAQHIQLKPCQPTLTQHNTTQPNTTQHNTTQHNTTQHNTTQHNTTQHNTTQHNTTQHNTTQHNTTHHSTAQHSTTQHNTTQHNTTQHNTTQHNTTQHNTTQHNTTQHNTTQHSTAQHNTTQHNTTQHNTTQHNTTQHNTTQHNTTKHSAAQRSTAQHSTAQHNTAQHSTAQPEYSPALPMGWVPGAKPRTTWPGHHPMVEGPLQSCGTRLPRAERPPTACRRPCAPPVPRHSLSHPSRAPVPHLLPQVWQPAAWRPPYRGFGDAAGTERVCGVCEWVREGTSGDTVRRNGRTCCQVAAKMPPTTGKRPPQPLRMGDVAPLVERFEATLPLCARHLVPDFVWVHRNVNAWFQEYINFAQPPWAPVR